MAEPKVITTDNFEAEVLKSDLPVLVDFWAVWCGPCKMTEPIIDALAKEYQGKVKVGKVNVDEHASLSSRYNILSIPAFLLFKGGQPVATLIGAQPKPAFDAMIKDNI
jgi:thioredoxin